jgi:hypothetical protein
MTRSLVINAELDYRQNAGRSINHRQLQKTLEMDPNFIRTHEVLDGLRRECMIRR